MKRNKHATICIVTACLIAVLVAVTVIGANTDYPSAGLELKGVSVAYTGTEGYQAFVDIWLYNVNAAGVAFAVEYDETVVKLSNAADNTLVNITVADAVAAPAFAQDTSIFPAGSFEATLLADAAPSHNAGHGVINMAFTPSKSVAEAANGDAITDKVIGSSTVREIVAGTGGVHIGKISFSITNMDAFLAMTQPELNAAIKLYTNAGGAMDNDIMYFPPAGDGIATADITDASAFPVTITPKAEQGALTQTLNYGNTPYGLIMGDPLVTDKVAAKTYFDQNFKLDPAHMPVGGDGDTMFRSSAWGSAADTEVLVGTTPSAGQYVNYDKDDTAIVVYTNQAFVDPGFKKLTNSLGAPVDMSTVTRTIAYQKLDNAQTTLVAKFDKATAATLTINPRASQVITEHKTADMRPGVYSMEYSYLDYDKKTTLKASRNVIVLSPLGDVDASGTAEKTVDNLLINNRFSVKLPDFVLTSYVKDGRLYLYRICDANKDGIINGVDGAMIKSGKQTYFYKALPNS